MASPLELECTYCLPSDIVVYLIAQRKFPCQGGVTRCVFDKILIKCYKDCLLKAKNGFGIHRK